MKKFFDDKNIKKIESIATIAGVALLAIGVLAYFSVDYAKGEVNAEQIRYLTTNMNELRQDVKEIMINQGKNTCQNQLTNIFPSMNLNANAANAVQQV